MGIPSPVHARTRSLAIRSIAESALQFHIHNTRQAFVYQVIAENASRLHPLGMSAFAIALALHGNEKTVAKVIQLGLPDEGKKMARSPSIR